MENILVIDETKDLAAPLEDCLRPQGFHVELAHDRQAGMEMALRRPYSLIVLDVMTPGGGTDLSALRRIRSGAATPVLVVAGQPDGPDRIAALDMGADDCLERPINPLELAARIRAVLRRTGGKEGPEIPPPSSRRIKVGDVEMDIGARVVLRSGEKISLTSVEFSILEVLLRRAGRLVSRGELAPVALGRSFFSNDRSIDVHVSRLRKKLGVEAAGVERIVAIRGEGYLYALTSEPEGAGPS